MDLPEFDLTDRIAIVTGGGTGIGRATALLLARRGADVAVAGRRPDPLDEASSEVRKIGRRGLAIPADVANADQAKRLIETVVEQLGRVDILINNAGGPHGHIGLSKMAPENWDRDVALNLSSAMYCSQAALPHLKATKGCIVNVSSVGGVHGTQGVAAYSAAKAGLQMLTRVSSAEWGPAEVRVNCVAPGMTATEKARAGWEARNYDAMEACQSFPLRRYGEMDEVAQAIVFFASDAASYITGETLAVAGGPQIKGMIEVE